MAEDGRIPTAQSDVMDSSGKRFTLAWFRFFAALEGVRKSLADGDADLTSSIEQIESDLTALQNTVNNLEITDCWTHFVPKVVNGDVVVVQKLPFAAKITSVVTDCASGTCTVTGKIDGVALGGTANSVSTTEQEQTHASDNEAAAGTTISYTVASNSACLGMRVQINYTRALG